ITDVILGAHVSGPGYTTASVGAQFVPDDTRASIDLVLSGHTDTDTIATKGPVRTYNPGQTTFVARKRVEIDADGPRWGCAVSCANVEAPRCRIETDRKLLKPLILPLARHIYNRDEAKANQISREHAQERVNRGFDRDADPQLEAARRDYEEKLRGPVSQRGV